MIHLGFTGTQKGMTAVQRERVAEVLRLAKARTFHHGDCIGADDQAHQLAVELGYRTIGHPCLLNGERAHRKRAFTQNDETREPLEPLARNRVIVAECDALVAAPKVMEEELRSGTWSTIRRAEVAGLTVTVVYPDGSVEAR